MLLSFTNCERYGKLIVDQERLDAILFNRNLKAVQAQVGAALGRKSRRSAKIKRVALLHEFLRNNGKV
jgi:hypothetical protein